MLEAVRFKVPRMSLLCIVAALVQFFIPAGAVSGEGLQAGEKLRIITGDHTVVSGRFQEIVADSLILKSKINTFTVSLNSIDSIYSYPRFLERSEVAGGVMGAIFGFGVGMLAELFKKGDNGTANTSESENVNLLKPFFLGVAGGLIGIVFASEYDNFKIIDKNDIMPPISGYYDKNQRPTSEHGFSLRLVIKL
jgi:hypothetical protein